MVTTKEQVPAAKAGPQRKKMPGAISDALAESKMRFAESISESFEIFLTATQQNNVTAAKVADQLKSLGFDGITTREQFREAVESLDLGVDENIDKFAKLLSLAQDFADISDPLDADYVGKNLISPLTAQVDNPPDQDDDKQMTDLTRQEVDAKITASEAKIDARLANFDASIKTGFADIRSEFANMRTDMAKIQVEMHKNTSDLLKWGLGIAIAIVGATVGLLTYINKTSEKPAVPSQPPSVYYIQPAPAPGVPPPALK